MMQRIALWILIVISLTGITIGQETQTFLSFGDGYSVSCTDGRVSIATDGAKIPEEIWGQLVDSLRNCDNVCVHFSDINSAISDHEMKLLAKIPNITQITSDTWTGAEGKITSVGYQNISSLSRLSALELRVGDVIGIASLEENSLLQELSLCNSKISIEGMLEFEKLTSLRHLDLKRTNIDDRSVGVLQSMTWLKSLDISGTKISPDGIDYLKKRLETTLLKADTDFNH
jgi:hypothetical protein